MSLNVVDFVVLEPSFSDMSLTQQLSFVFNKLSNQSTSLSNVPYNSLLDRMNQLNTEYDSKFYFYRQSELCSLTGRSLEDKWYVTNELSNDDKARLVRYDYRFISQIDQTDELCDLALRMNPAALLWIQNPTVEQWQYMLSNPSLVTSFDRMRVPNDLYDECLKRVQEENNRARQMSIVLVPSSSNGQWVEYSNIKKVNSPHTKRQPDEVHYVRRRSDNPYQRTNYVVKPLKMTQQEKYMKSVLEKCNSDLLKSFKSLKSLAEKAEWYQSLPQYSNFPCHLVVGNQRPRQFENVRDVSF